MKSLLVAAALIASASADARACVASYYGAESGTHTANGETWRPMGLTAAHRTLRFGTRIRVSVGGRSVVVRVNDRGPAAWTGRCIDLSHGAARALGIERRGTAPVTMEVIAR